MSQNEFWDLIDSARRSVSTTDQITKWLIQRLTEMSESEIVDFGKHFRDASRFAYDERLWAAAIAISDHFSSDDVFSDFCAWLIAQGKPLYTRVLANPDFLADIELENEATIANSGFWVASAASKAYKTKTGRADFSERLGALPPPKLRNEKTWDGEPNTLVKVVPKLYYKYRASTTVGNQ